MEHPREESISIRQGVALSRSLQADRYKKEGIYSNSQLRPKQIKKYCEVGEDSKRLIEMAMTKLGLSARAYHRILKVARTTADLDKREKISSPDVSEAIQYRSLDRRTTLA